MKNNVRSMGHSDSTVQGVGRAFARVQSHIVPLTIIGHNNHLKNTNESKWFKNK